MKVFEDIWQAVSEEDESGLRFLRYASRKDLVFLYDSGFVDAEKYSVDDWVDAFKPSLQKDESYKVSYDQWMEKQKYYYSGPIREPFDAMKIPERDFTLEEFEDMLRTCIVPSTQMGPEKVPEYIESCKKRGMLSDGKIKMTPEVKKELGEFLTLYPSPLRILEVNVKRLREGGAAPEGVSEAAQKTGFAVGKTAAQRTSSKLDSLLSGQTAAPSKGAKDSGVSLKDLQKQSVKKRPV